MNADIHKKLLDEAKRPGSPLMMSDVLFCDLDDDMTNSEFAGRSSAGPQYRNTSVEPKTVGQITRQLLASWDAPPAVSIEEWKKRQNQENNTAKE